MNSKIDNKGNDQDEPTRANDPVTPLTIPVIVEQLNVGKKVVETGRVHISRKTLEEEYNTEIPVFKEEVVVERKNVGQYIDGEKPGIRMVGDTTIIPVIKEVVVKRLLLVEELHITRITTTHSVPVTETLRRDEVSVVRKDNDVPGGNFGT